MNNFLLFDMIDGPDDETLICNTTVPHLDFEKFSTNS